MYKKTITYTDYSDNPQEITEDFYFDLSIIELAENGWVDGTIVTELNACIDSSNISALIRLFKKIITASFGVRSADRKRFHKDPKITRDFIQSDAYQQLITELITDETGKKIEQFIIGILPKKINGQTIDYTEAIEEARKQAEETYGLPGGDSNADDNSATS